MVTGRGLIDYPVRYSDIEGYLKSLTREDILQPTEAAPGSAKKLAILIRRREMETMEFTKGLFLEEDNRDEFEIHHIKKETVTVRTYNRLGYMRL